MPARYVLSERAASALRDLIAPGAAYGSRKRPTHDVPPEGAAPLFLDCRIRAVETAGEGDDPATMVDHVQVYLTPGGPPASIRVNGRRTTLEYTAGNLGADGWLDLGPAETITAVWLSARRVPGFSGTGDYGGATDWTGTAVAWGFDVAGDANGPGAAPADAFDDRWPRFLHPVLVALVRGGAVVQCVHGGMDLTQEVPDADGTHTGEATAQDDPPVPAGGYCSVEMGDSLAGEGADGAPTRLQLFQFRRAAHLIAGSDSGNIDPASASIDLVLRVHDFGQAGSMSRARVHYLYLPSLIDWLTRTLGDDFEQWLRSHIGDVAEMLKDFSEDNDGPFWISGDDLSSCYGVSIGDANGTLVIHLQNRELHGAWKTENGQLFQVDGPLDCTDNAVVSGDLTVNSNASVAGNLAVTGDTTVDDLTITGAIKVGADTYIPQQIVLANGNTLTVLAKQ